MSVDDRRGAPGVTLPPPDPSFEEEVREVTAFLERVAADRQLLDTLPSADRARILRAVSQVHAPNRAQRRRASSAARMARTDRVEAVRADTGIRALRRRPVVTTPSVFAPPAFAPHDVHADPETETGGEAHEAIEPQHCYVCKERYSTIHHFYDQLCPGCATFNYGKRDERADLRGRVALLTGGRVKIGYYTGLKLLRCGAHLIVTTRFPRDAAMRYAAEPDFPDWGHRLEVFGLDLRHTPSVDAFCKELLATRSRLDFIVNNACQTVRRPPEFYAHMMAGETAALHEMPEHVRRLVGSYEGLRGYHLLPEGGRSERTGPTAGRSERTGPTAGPSKRTRSTAQTTGPTLDVTGLTHAAQLSQVLLLPEEMAREERAAQKDLFP